ncbi:hypothetical protein JB92DRAFT_3145022 [Gautieria morchelliformis]|nr:hypothetical protein JB92DRAFT_3145022 [Gautieria morchelliformis]
MSYNYPASAPGDYGQQFNSGQPYAPQSYQPPPESYSASAPNLGQPLPQGSYSISPSGQYGASHPPGQYGAASQYGIQAPPGGYGTPPPAPYAPHPQPGAPSGPGQMIDGPPRYGGTYSQAPPSPTPQPQQSITFRITEPGKGILNSEVVDPWRRTGWTVSSPSKKETWIKNQGGNVVGRIEWHSFSSAKLEFLGYHGKVKEFIAKGREKHKRVIRYNKQNYDVVEESGAIYIRPRFDPGVPYAIIRGSTEIEITSGGLAQGNRFIEHVILVAVCYRSGHSFGDSDSGPNMAGVWAAGAAAGVATT